MLARLAGPVWLTVLARLAGPIGRTGLARLAGSVRLTVLARLADFLMNRSTASTISLLSTNVRSIGALLRLDPRSLYT